MMSRSSLALLGLLGLLLVSPLALRTTGQERVATPQEISNREIKLEHELGRLRDMVSGMGENHPQLNAAKKRISELQAELVAMSRGAGPFAEALMADRNDVDNLLNQMSDAEVRQAVLHLFGKMKDLERRLDRLEGSTF